MGYVSVIEALTINDENRLRQENETLKVSKPEIEQLKEKAEKYEDFMATFNPQLEAFQLEINSLKLHLNSESSRKNNKKKSNSSNKKQTENIQTATDMSKMTFLTIAALGVAIMLSPSVVTNTFAKSSGGGDVI
jgi:septal ring factor EnvC (AmiA/AmiB activator)